MKLVDNRSQITTGAVFVLIVLSLIGGAAPARAQQDLEVVQLRPNFYMIAGAGGNIAVQTGPDGVVLVDAGSQEAADRVLAQIKKLSDQPIRYIINTSADPERVGGNAKLAQAGRSIFATGVAPLGGEFGRAITGGYPASIIATENVLLKMSAPTGKVAPFPNAGWPSETFDQKRKYIYFNNEGIEIFRQFAAHSDGDTVVLFRGSDVLAAGAVLDMTRFPVIELDKGGTIQGEIDALNRLIELSVSPIPFAFQEGGTLIVPGRGRLCDQADLVEYRDIMVIIRDTIQDMVKRGMTLEQVKAAYPTKPFEPLYGSKSGPWTTDNFVEAVYKSLAAKK